jgi:hypothetical protein
MLTAGTHTWPPPPRSGPGYRSRSATLVAPCPTPEHWNLSRSSAGPDTNSSELQTEARSGWTDPEDAKCSTDKDEAGPQSLGPVRAQCASSVGPSP